jgi:hypothetical protein
MSKIIITYSLKATTTPAQFESWTRGTDYPLMRGLSRVNSFINYRTIKHLMDDVKPSVDYIEIFDIPDLAGFIAEDMGGSVVQKVMGEFLQHVESSEFIIVEEVV